MAAHKFAIGQTVRFSPDRFDRHQVSSGGGGRFKIVRHLPEAASILQYRVKSQVDGHERVVTAPRRGDLQPEGRTLDRQRHGYRGHAKSRPGRVVCGVARGV